MTQIKHNKLNEGRILNSIKKLITARGYRSSETDQRIEELTKRFMAGYINQINTVLSQGAYVGGGAAPSLTSSPASAPSGPAADGGTSGDLTSTSPSVDKFAAKRQQAAAAARANMAQPSTTPTSTTTSTTSTASGAVRTGPGGARRTNIPPSAQTLARRNAAEIAKDRERLLGPEGGANESKSTKKKSISEQLTSYDRMNTLFESILSIQEQAAAGTPDISDFIWQQIVVPEMGAAAQPRRSELNTMIQKISAAIGNSKTLTRTATKQLFDLVKYMITSTSQDTLRGDGQADKSGGSNQQASPYDRFLSGSSRQLKDRIATLDPRLQQSLILAVVDSLLDGSVESELRGSYMLRQLRREIEKNQSEIDDKSSTPAPAPAPTRPTK